MAKIRVNFTEEMVDRLESDISNGAEIEIDFAMLDGDIEISSDVMSKDDLENIYG